MGDTWAPYAMESELAGVDALTSETTTLKSTIKNDMPPMDDIKKSEERLDAQDA